MAEVGGEAVRDVDAGPGAAEPREGKAGREARHGAVARRAPAALGAVPIEGGAAEAPGDEHEVARARPAPPECAAAPHDA